MFLVYYHGTSGGVCNYENNVIRSEGECMNAIWQLSMSPQGSIWKGINWRMPAGCSIRNGGDRRPHLDYTLDTPKGVGFGRENLIPICKTYSNISEYF